MGERLALLPTHRQPRRQLIALTSVRRTMLLTAAFFASALILTTVTAAPLQLQIRQQKQTGRLVVFGDSFSDDGHGAWIVSNNTWPADPAYYGHHFSNGPVWAQQAAGNFSGYYNHATGGATANNSAVQGYTGPGSTIPVPDVITQVSAFLTNNTVQAGDTYVIYIGANDFFFDPNITGSRVAQSIGNSANRLVSLGAKRIVFGNYPDLGALPAVAAGSNQSIAAIRMQGAQLRLGLRDVVTGLQKNNVSSTIVDVYSLFQVVSANPAAYGFDPSIWLQPCLVGAYEKDARKLCTDPEKRFFFDTYHPQTNVHQLVGEYASLVLLNVS